MPVLAQIEDIVEPARVLDGRVESRRPHFLFVRLLCSVNLVVGEFMVGVGVHSSVDLGVELSFLYELCGLHILQKPLFGKLLFQLVSRQF